MGGIEPPTRGFSIREILAFRFPTVSELLPQAPTPQGASAALSEAKSGKRGRALLGLLMMGGAVAGLTVTITAWFVWVGLAIWGWVTFSNREIEPGPFQKAFNDADEKVQRELESFVRRNGLTEVVKVRSDLDATIATYKGHDDALTRDLMILRSNRESRQRHAYLDGFSIRRANISGIGPSKKATLISFGIETAADVNRSAVLSVPGFGNVMAKKLMDWRTRHESRFMYDHSANSQDVTDERALRGRFAAEKAKLEASIRNGLGTLRNAKARLDALPAKARADSALLGALGTRAQAAHDLKTLGAFVPVSTVALTATPPQPPRAPRVITPTAPRATVTSAVQSCPRCGSIMRQRSGPYGQFWGCLRYPICKGTRK